jgi:hypothetical protein
MAAVAEAVEAEFLSSCFEDFLRLTSRATCCERRRYKMQIPIQAPRNPCTTSRRDFASRRWTSLIAPECRWWNSNRDFLERRATALTLGLVQIDSSSIQSVDLACWRSHQGKSYRQVQSHTEATCTAALRTSTRSESCRPALADCRSSPNPNPRRQQTKHCQLLHLGVLRRLCWWHQARGSCRWDEGTLMSMLCTQPLRSRSCRANTQINECMSSALKGEEV